MRLWIDDFREPPDVSWVWAKTLREALYHLHRNYFQVTEISFDHDLEGGDTSIPIAEFIERAAYYGVAQPPAWYLHSQNPVGAKNLTQILKRAEFYWEKRWAGSFNG